MKREQFSRGVASPLGPDAGEWADDLMSDLGLDGRPHAGSVRERVEGCLQRFGREAVAAFERRPSNPNPCPECGCLAFAQLLCAACWKQSAAALAVPE